jgi:hypothetical protein
VASANGLVPGARGQPPYSYVSIETRAPATGLPSGLTTVPENVPFAAGEAAGTGFEANGMSAGRRAQTAQFQQLRLKCWCMLRLPRDLRLDLHGRIIRRREQPEQGKEIVGWHDQCNTLILMQFIAISSVRSVRF